MQVTSLRKNNHNNFVLGKSPAFKSKELIISDVDGTLIASETIQRRAWQNTANKIAADFNKPPINIDTFYECGSSNSTNFKLILDRLEPNLTEADRLKYRTYKYECYQRIMEDKVSAKGPDSILVPGARRFLEEVGKHFRLVATSNSMSSEMALNAAQLGHLFKKSNTPPTLIDGLDKGKIFENTKPAPDIFLAVAKLFGVAPDKCLVIEDTLRGSQAAEAAGMEHVIIGNAQIPENRFRIGQFADFTKINISNFLKRFCCRTIT